jgi:glycosyltransferase involved in cell wall biosynthesis
MRILFLDQSGKPGGAELVLLDLAQHFKADCLVGLFVDGSFRQMLADRHIPVEVLHNETIAVNKDSGLWRGLQSLKQLLPMMQRVIQLARTYDIIYANTQKALVLGAIVSSITGKPLVYHLHDIVSDEHFSTFNKRLIILCAKQAKLIITNSQASREAFIAAGGQTHNLAVVDCGFDLNQYTNFQTPAQQLRQELNLEGKFAIGHFSRLSPWKGQHILIEALQHCPENVVALLIGDALFGETDYVKQLQQQVKEHGLVDRVHFLGFRQDIPQLMSACDLVAHTSTAPEPFGRVIVEAMLCGTPVIAAAAGGAAELVIHAQTGWLSQPGNVKALAQNIHTCYHQTPGDRQALIDRAKTVSQERFHLDRMNQQVENLLAQLGREKDFKGALIV